MNDKVVCAIKVETNYESKTLKDKFHINRNGVS